MPDLADLLLEVLDEAPEDQEMPTLPDEDGANQRTGANRRTRWRLDQPEPFAHDEGAARNFVPVSAPVSEPCRAPVLGGGVSLTLIDRELQAHAFERHDLNPRYFDVAAGFIGETD
jgi:hypothetical protein